MTLNYTSVDRIYSLEPMVGSISDLTSSQLVTAFAIPAEAEINARLSRRYLVPLSATVPLIQSIADDLSVYRVLSRRVFTADQLKESVWPDKFKEAVDTLKEVADGKVLLVDSSGTQIAMRTDTARAASNTDGYPPTFHDGGNWCDQVRSEDKTTDENDERSL